MKTGRDLHQERAGRNLHQVHGARGALSNILTPLWSWSRHSGRPQALRRRLADVPKPTLGGGPEPAPITPVVEPTVDDKRRHSGKVNDKIGGKLERPKKRPTA